MAGKGRRFTFHGAFGSKSKAVEREREIPGAFVKPMKVRGQTRYAVITRREGVNPKRRKNPLLLEYLNPRSSVIGRIPGTLEEIRYQRTGKHAGPYKHKFNEAADILALRGGGLLIQPRNKRHKLWSDLPD